MPRILDDKAMMTCAHQGKVEVTASNGRVTIDGSAVVTRADVHSITGCTFPPASGGPCVTASFATAATRVTVAGVPVLLENNVALCSPTSTPLSVVSTQQRVTAK